MPKGKNKQVSGKGKSELDMGQTKLPVATLLSDKVGDALGVEVDSTSSLLQTALVVDSELKSLMEDAKTILHSPTVPIEFEMAKNPAEIADEYDSDLASVAEQGLKYMAAAWQEVNTTHVEALSIESNTPVSPEGENVATISTESLNPIEATPVNLIPEIQFKDVLISGPKINEVIENVLWAASLGGDLTPQKLPSLMSLPYSVKMQIPESRFEEYVAGLGKPVYSKDVEYNEVAVTSQDPLVFVKRLIDLGKRGAFIRPQHQAKAGSLNQVKLLMHNPVPLGPQTTALGVKVKYTKAELVEFKLDNLQLIALSYGFKGRSKNDLIREILIKQGEN